MLATKVEYLVSKLSDLVSPRVGQVPPKSREPVRASNRKACRGDGLGLDLRWCTDATVLCCISCWLYLSSPDQGGLGSWAANRAPLLLSRRLWRSGRDVEAMMQGYPIGLLAVDRLWITLPCYPALLWAREQHEKKKARSR